MLRREIGLAGLGILLLVALTVWICIQPRKPQVTFDLADGTRMEFISVTQGKVLRFYEGMFWQKILFALCRTNISSRWAGLETSFMATNANGGLGLELRHAAANGVLQMPVNSSERLALVDTRGNEVAGARVAVYFVFPDAANVSNGFFENIYWEFPLATEREVHFRFYQTNYFMGKRVSTNEFVVPNPTYR